MPLITDARIEQCDACERNFDINFPKRMQKYQRVHRREQQHFWPCSFLERRFYQRGCFAELCDTPWDDKPRKVFFHDENCEAAYCSSGSFDYVWCEGCDRRIYEQNPSNGWHLQFRHHADLGYVCLSCYEKEILENGQPLSDFEGNTIRGGMFFSSDNHEPRGAGFDEVPEFSNYFVASNQEAFHYNQHASRLIGSGRKVITGYERLAIGGLEGHITMFAKCDEKQLKAAMANNGR